MSKGKPKVLLILEKSEDLTTQVGLVKDCGGSMPVNMSTCNVVGTWSRYNEGTFYIELTTPIDALQDILTQLISERVKSREMATYPIIRTLDLQLPSTTRQPRQPKAIQDGPSVDLNDLRARLGRKI